MMKKTVYLSLIAFTLTLSACGKESLLSPLAAFWKKVKPIEVQLMPQSITTPNGGSMKTVSVQGVVSGDKVLFRASWKDETSNIHFTGDKFADGVALMFPTTTSGKTSPFMGDASNPVVIWQWRADWQNPEKMKEEISKSYPAYADWYPPHEKPFFENLGRHPEAGKAAIYMAQGFGTLTFQPIQTVEVEGTYDSTKKMYFVVFSRNLISKDEKVQFTAEGEVYFNVAVWDGSKNERGARKSVSMAWQEIEKLEKKP